MKINCTIDGSPYSIIANADKPLNIILQEKSDTYLINNSCLSAECGNCLIFFNGICLPSCLIPAFKLNGAIIQTFEGYRKTRFYHDIERAYAELGYKPCKQCYASKTLLIESLINKLDKVRLTYSPSNINDNNEDEEKNLSSEFIHNEIKINKCKCLSASQIDNIIQLAYLYRRRRSGKKL